VPVTGKDALTQAGWAFCLEMPSETIKAAVDLILSMEVNQQKIKL